MIATPTLSGAIRVKVTAPTVRPAKVHAPLTSMPTLTGIPQGGPHLVDALGDRVVKLSVRPKLMYAGTALWDSAVYPGSDASVYVSDVLAAPASYTYVPSTGVLTFTTDPGASAVVKIGGATATRTGTGTYQAACPPWFAWDAATGTFTVDRTLSGITWEP